MRFPDTVQSLVGRAYRYVCRPGPVRTLEVAYVILPSDEAHNYMSKLEIEILKQYGPHEGLKATPHITLKLGFRVPDIQPFEQYFDQLVADIEPFEVCIKNIGFFDEVGIVFMDVVPTTELESLRQRILRELSDQYGIKPYPLEGDQYRFHATLAYLQKEDFSKARRELEKIKIEFKFVLDTIGLICHAGDEWVTYKRARLMQPAAGIRASAESVHSLKSFS